MLPTQPTLAWKDIWALQAFYQTCLLDVQIPLHQPSPHRSILLLQERKGMLGYRPSSTEIKPRTLAQLDWTLCNHKSTRYTDVDFCDHIHWLQRSHTLTAKITETDCNDHNTDCNDHKNCTHSDCNDHRH